MPSSKPPQQREAQADQPKPTSDGAPLRERVKPIVERLQREAKPGGSDLTKDEIDRMWGHD